MKRLFTTTFLFFLILWWLAGFAATRTEQLDSQIQELKDMKRGCEARALRHEDMAEYMQFEQQQVLETRRHLQIADEDRAKAARAQMQIDRLEEERAKLSR
jgi:hypothetical protein